MADSKIQIAIVGSGPSAFYAAEALLNSEHDVQVDMLEKLPMPYGLVRYGVAPDHAKLKGVTMIYNRIAESDNFGWFGNVRIGKDISIEELRELYHAVIFAYGAETDREMGIPGEHLAGSHAATEFVGWYNGHPEYRDRDFDLSCETAVVIGNGNVAIDVARILSKSAEELHPTDITSHAVEKLKQSKIREVYVIGRRGPVQAKFTSKELREFLEIGNCAPSVLAEDLNLNEASATELQEAEGTDKARNFDIFNKFSELERTEHPRQCHFRFFLSPVEIKGEGGVRKIVLERNELIGEKNNQCTRPTGETIEIPCGLVFRSVGYKGKGIEGLPFNESRGVIQNEKGRIRSENGELEPFLYCTGWIKRGPSGVIGTNRADSLETVESILEDFARTHFATKAGADGVRELLTGRDRRWISFDEWKNLDALEVSNGQEKGKIREKYTSVDDALSALT